MVVCQEKCSMQIFTKKRNISSLIRVKNLAIPINKNQRLLGLIFDSPCLTWRAHITYLSEEIRKRIDLMKIISSINWGASKKILRTFYIGFVRSKIDYGCAIYGIAAETNLIKLDKLQNAALRLILGARRTSPIISLEVEAYIAPLKIRRAMLASKQFLKLLNRPEDDKTVETLKIKKDIKTNNYQSMCNSFITNGLKYLELFGIRNCKRVPTNIVSKIPPWYQLDNCVFSYMDRGPAHIQINTKELFHNLVENKYSTYKFIFTDGSKITEPEISVASGMYLEYKESITCWKLDPRHSVIAAELFAIKQALIITKQEQLLNFAIFTDSRAATFMIRSPAAAYKRTVEEIKTLIYEIQGRKRTVVIQWIKAHCDIKGNEIADCAANLGHKNNKSEIFPLHMEEYVSLLRNGYISHWCDSWKYAIQNSDKGAFLGNIKDTIERSPWAEVSNRRAEVAMSRLPIGHAGVNQHMARFNMVESNLCDRCGVIETINHFLLECHKHQTARTEMQSALRKIGIQQDNLKILLGGGNQPLGEKRYISRCLVKYLIRTEEMNRL